VRNTAAFIRFLHIGTKGCALLVLPCALGACAYGLIPAALAAAADSRLDSTAASVLAAALGVCGWIFAYITGGTAAGFAADFSFRLRREVFRQILNQESGCNADFPETQINTAADVISPAMDFLGRFLFLFVLTASLVFLRPLPALGVIASFPAAFLAAWAARVMERKADSARRESENPERRFAALLGALPYAEPGGDDSFPARDMEKTANAFCGPRSRAAIILAPVFPLALCAAGLTLALFVYAAGRWFPEEMTRGVWLVCLFTIPAVFWNISLMSAFAGRFRRARAAADELQGILEMEPPLEVSGNEAALHVTGAVELSGLSVFRGEEKLLENVSLNIPTGQKVALAGTHAGSLSCLLRVLARLLEYNEGELRMDGKDIRMLDIAELREKIDFVPEEAFHFEGTLEENILRGRPSASDEEVRGAAAKLGRGDWLYDLPDGLSTRIERGKPLPVWAPLVLLAKSLLRRPALCLIDEPPPAADPLVEVRIQEALYTLIAGRTAVIAARRLSTLRQADRIIVFDGSRAAEEGVHDELLACKGLYAKIYEKYFRHQSPDYLGRLNDTIIV
jgi:ABC-type multidrug transport system fused ATPase/permease subunit